MTWYHTGGRRARTRIAAREWREVERERQRATEIDVEPERELVWPDRALGWLWGRDMVPDDLAATCSDLMYLGIRGLGVEEAAEHLGHTRHTVKKRLARAGLPSANRWRALGQMLGAAEVILVWGESGRAAAKEVSLPTSSRLSETLHTHAGLRIDYLYRLPSPQWRAVVERWWEEWAG